MQSTRFAKHRNSQQGSEILEFAVVLPFLAFLLCIVVLLGPYIHIRFATHQAAYDCALSAAQSLDRAQGFMQGVSAARQSFVAFNLNPGLAQVAVAGAWERHSQTVCTVGYRVPLEQFPLAVLVDLPPEVSFSVTLPVQTWKSTWK